VHLQRDLLSLITPYHLRLPWCWAQSTSGVSSSSACWPAAPRLLTAYVTHQVRLLTDTSPGTGLHERDSEKCIYLCYLASSLGHTLLTQMIKLRIKNKQHTVPSLASKTKVPYPKPAFAGISVPVPVQQVCAYLGMFDYPTLRIFKARGS